MTLGIAVTLLLLLTPGDSEDSSDFALCGVVSIVLSLSGSPTLSVMSHARGREFREFKEYREVRAKANKAKRPKRQGT